MLSHLTPANQYPARRLLLPHTLLFKTLALAIQGRAVGLSEPVRSHQRQVPFKFTIVSTMAFLQVEFLVPGLCFDTVLITRAVRLGRKVRQAPDI